MEEKLPEIEIGEGGKEVRGLLAEENVEKNTEESTDGAEGCMSVLVGRLDNLEVAVGDCMLLGCSHPV
jgi:hypothetical protein